jgi:hypothetical protein
MAYQHCLPQAKLEMFKAIIHALLGHIASLETFKKIFTKDQ